MRLEVEEDHGDAWIKEKLLDKASIISVLNALQ